MRLRHGAGASILLWAPIAARRRHERYKEESLANDVTHVAYWHFIGAFSVRALARATGAYVLSGFSFEANSALSPFYFSPFRDTPRLRSLRSFADAHYSFERLRFWVRFILPLVIYRRQFRGGVL